VLQTILFDLSEVLIAGMPGFEKPLAENLALPPEQVLAAFYNEVFHNLVIGKISEQAYFEEILAREGWPLTVEELKSAIRLNFENLVPGMQAVLACLASHYELVLLSDHAAEWVEAIVVLHPFLEQFKARFFSFELGATKRSPATFHTVLAALQRRPDECLFIDDFAPNVEVARSLGIAGIQFLNAADLVQQLARMGAWPCPQTPAGNGSP